MTSMNMVPPVPPAASSCPKPWYELVAPVPTLPDGAATGAALQECLVDAGQRAMLLLDILRERGNEQAEMASRPLATVLTFGHEILMSGHGLRRPINYSLARVVQPAGTRVDPSKRPVVIVDPRA